MSVLNIDLSEYDAMISHTKELEEQVKELKEQVQGFKDGSKVILRKETVIESVCSDLPYSGYAPEKFRRTIERSESFVGFEDVRLKRSVLLQIKKYSDISKAAEKKWEDDLNSLERRKNCCMRTIRQVQDIAERAQKILTSSWIRKKDVEEMMSQIIHSCDESINWHEEA